MFLLLKKSTGKNKKSHEAITSQPISKRNRLSPRSSTQEEKATGETQTFSEIDLSNNCEDMLIRDSEDIFGKHI